MVEVVAVVVASPGVLRYWKSPGWWRCWVGGGGGGGGGMGFYKGEEWVTDAVSL